MAASMRDGVVPPRRATIHDVARQAGVSHQTVSRFLSKPEGLKAPTRARVEAAVADLSYRPSAIARSMRTKRSTNILIVLPSLISYFPFEILKGASEEASLLGFSLEVLVLEGKADGAAERLMALGASGQVGGILLLSQIPGIAADTTGATWGAPLVILGEYDSQMHSVGAFANPSTVVDVVRLLVDVGHRRILHVAGPQDWPSARNRREAFEHAIAQFGLPALPSIESAWTIRAGYEAAGRIPDPISATAIFAANDRIALGVMRRLEERGLTVPGDVSLVGWDDDPMSEFLSPPLTTVHMDRELQGRDGVRALVSTMDGTSIQPLEDRTRDSLVIRGSVAAPAF
jgi:DNA-binding LacI/PurR family transcriptional regulator